MVRDLPWLAEALDQAAAQPSHHGMVEACRATLGLGPILSLPKRLPIRQRALAWAIDYHVELIVEGKRRHVRLIPAFVTESGTTPPHAHAAPANIAKVWQSLLPLVTSAPAKARLHHLLFERRGPETTFHARSAAEAYLSSARHWVRTGDSVTDLVAATRLAHAAKDTDLSRRSLDAMADLIEEALALPQTPVAAILDALDHLVAERECPSRVDTLLEEAVTAIPDAERRDRAFALMLKRCRDPELSLAVWERRVDSFLDEAANASSEVMRALRLQRALAVAEGSANSRLRRKAAAQLQENSDGTLPMLHIWADAHCYEEEFERRVDLACRGGSWEEALLSFASVAPLSGDAAWNRRHTEQAHQQYPMSALFPTALVTPEGLPLFQGADGPGRLDVDTARAEAERIEQHFPVMAAALHEVVRRHGFPTLAELGTFLTQTLTMTPAVAGPVARAFFRYWTEDAEAASYTVLPQLEALIRDAVIDSGIGVYRLQRDRSPGQFPGLGVLLPILEEGGLDESVCRFLSVLLTHPAGMNLRNLALHGYMRLLSSGYAAVLLHAALVLGRLRVQVASEAAAPEGQGS